MTPEQTAATGCLAFAVVLAATWWRGQRRARTGARLFTREQRAQLGEVYTANCIFRPCHWLPLAPLLVGLAAGWPRLTLEVFAVLTGIGTPPALRAHRCAGPMQGGHQRAHSRGGTTSLWNGVPECFPAGVHVTTSVGQVPIESVTVGDLVLTGQGRFRPVTATASRISATVVVAGSGNGGLETTRNHPFLARKFTGRRNGKGHIAIVALDASEWVRADNLAGHWWSYLAGPTEPLPIPPTPFPADDLSKWWLIGRWLGDGSLTVASPGEPRPRLTPVYVTAPGPCIRCGSPARQTARPGLWSSFCSRRCSAAQNRERRRAAGVRSAVLSISCGYHEAEGLASVLPPGWCRNNGRTAVVFSTYTETELVGWIDQHFGHLAHEKHLPTWALSLPTDARRSMLAGYVSADGNVKRADEQTTITTVSRQLAVGVKLLADSLGYHAHLSAPHGGGPGRIEGRTVTTRPASRVSWVANRTRAPKAKTIDGIVFAPVRTVTPGRETVPVFCLTVADDESFIADGMIVHNCRRHNLEHRAGSTFAYACTLGPISLVPYLVRVATGGVRLLLRKGPA